MWQFLKNTINLFLTTDFVLKKKVTVITLPLLCTTAYYQKKKTLCIFDSSK
jgi:hypothetical protein